MTKNKYGFKVSLALAFLFGGVMEYLRKINGLGVVNIDEDTAYKIDSWEAGRTTLHQAVDQYVNSREKEIINNVSD